MAIFSFQAVTLYSSIMFDRNMPVNSVGNIFLCVWVSLTRTKIYFLRCCCSFLEAEEPQGNDETDGAIGE